MQVVTNNDFVENTQIFRIYAQSTYLLDLAGDCFRIKVKNNIDER